MTETVVDMGSLEKTIKKVASPDLGDDPDVPDGPLGT